MSSSAYNRMDSGAPGSKAMPDISSWDPFAMDADPFAGSAQSAAAFATPVRAPTHAQAAQPPALTLARQSSQGTTPERAPTTVSGSRPGPIVAPVRPLMNLHVDSSPHGPRTPVKSPFTPRQAAGRYPASSPTKKRCAFSGCVSERFARGYCASHLTQFPSETPTGKIRKTYNLWARTETTDKAQSDQQCTVEWKLTHKDASHIVVLTNDPFCGARSISLDGELLFAGAPDMGYWTYDFVIGRSFSSQLDIRIEVMPTLKGYKYELYVDKLPFDEARAQFLSQLSTSKVLQRLSMDPVHESQSSKHPQQHRQQSSESEQMYVAVNWDRLSNTEKTKLGYTKSRLHWHFTIHGKKHTVEMEHGHTGGKKKIMCDGTVVYERRPGLTGRHKAFSHTFDVSGVPCEVKITRNHEYSSKAAKSHSSDDNQPFHYDLTVEGVPWDSIVHGTTADLAGGDVMLDRAAERRKSMEGVAARAASAATRAKHSHRHPLASPSHSAVMALSPRAATHDQMTREDLDELNLVESGFESDSD